MSQLALQWPIHAGYAPEDFIVAGANRDAHAFIGHWPESQQRLALLVGPQGCGKTHLARCWAERVKAVFLDTSRVGEVPSDAVRGNAPYAVMENIESITDEPAFFHLLRHIEQGNGHVLLTSQLAPRQLPFVTQDVQSRLLALPVAYIAEPDEELLRAFFAKALSDRQWRVQPALIDFLVLRCERTFLAAQEIMRRLEHYVSTTKKELTLAAIKPMIENH